MGTVFRFFGEVQCRETLSAHVKSQKTGVHKPFATGILALPQDDLSSRDLAEAGGIWRRSFTVVSLLLLRFFIPLWMASILYIDV